jgi:hypothetical protein
MKHSLIRARGAEIAGAGRAWISPRAAARLTCSGNPKAPWRASSGPVASGCGVAFDFSFSVVSVIKPVPAGGFAGRL